MPHAATPFPRTPIQAHFDDNVDMDRIEVVTTPQANMHIVEIGRLLNLTIRQVYRAIYAPVTPERRGRPRRILNTPMRRQLRDWVEGSPSYRIVPWNSISFHLGWNCGSRAITTALKSMEVCSTSFTPFYSANKGPPASMVLYP
jgi:hypothetical protein